MLTAVFRPGIKTPEAVYTVFTDITSLRQSEERLAMAMSATGEGIWDYDLSNRRRYPQRTLVRYA